MFITTTRPDHYEDTAAARVAAASKYFPGETVGERDSGDIYLRTITSWLLIITAGSPLVTAYASPGLIKTRIAFFDDGPASVAIASNVVAFAVANLITFTFATPGLRYVNAVTKLIGTTSQQYAVMTMNAGDNINAVERLSHTANLDADRNLIELLPGNEPTRRKEEVDITRIDLACVGTTPAVNNGLIVFLTLSTTG